MTYRSHYPIGKLVIDLLNRSGLTLDELVRQLGYRKTIKGETEFLFLINHGLCELKFRDALTKFVSDKVSLELAWQRTAEIRLAEDEEGLMRLEERERKAFRPHLLPLYSPVGVGSKPNPSIWRNKTRSSNVILPLTFSNQPEDRQIALVKGKIQEHYPKHSGITPHGERLSAYVLFCDFEGEGRYFSTSGEPVDSADTDEDASESIITLDEVTLARIDRGDFDEE